MNTTNKAGKLDLVDYRQFRFSKLNTPEFSHLKYLLFWPIYGLLFLTVERLWIRDSYAPVHCALDDAIPFCELFLLPYLFWFVFLVGMLLYTLLRDPDAFRGMMRFIIVSYSAAILIYMLFPNCQQLRPLAFQRDNPLTRFIARFYEFDTNTNVCPSIHVIGSAAAMFAAWDSRDFQTAAWRIAFLVTALLISVSTVFIKQHSVLDLLAAVPVCGAAYWFAYGKKGIGAGKGRPRKTEKTAPRAG